MWYKLKQLQELKQDEDTANKIILMKPMGISTGAILYN